jgi:hypothetical protein
MIISGALPLNVQQAVDALCAGELVGLPTETVYGLAADASNASAVAARGGADADARVHRHASGVSGTG